MHVPTYTCMWGHSTNNLLQRLVSFPVLTWVSGRKLTFHSIVEKCYMLTCVTSHTFHIQYLCVHTHIQLHLWIKCHGDATWHIHARVLHETHRSPMIISLTHMQVLKATLSLSVAKVVAIIMRGLSDIRACIHMPSCICMILTCSALHHRLWVHYLPG